jgi:hypothetical protein
MRSALTKKTATLGFSRVAVFACGETEKIFSPLRGAFVVREHREERL